MSGDRASDDREQPGDMVVSGATDADPGARARAEVAGTRFGDVRWVAETGSTNADALALARDGAPEGIVLVADHQTAGRGRRSRTWVSLPGGSLLVSVLLRPPAAVVGSATMAASLAMAEAVEQVAGVSPGLKWPNDLVVDDRKLAGVLAEADWPAGSTISAGWRPPRPQERIPVVVGIGLNVVWPKPRHPPGPGAGGTGPIDAATAPGPAGAEDGLAELADTATALSWLGARVDRVDLLVGFLRRLEARYGELVGGGAAGVLAAWRRRSATLGRRVRVDLGSDDVEGTAVDVTDEGLLVVDTLAGDRRTLAVGDVVHLRPA